MDKIKYPMTTEEIVKGKFLEYNHIKQIIMRLNRLSTEILKLGDFGGSKYKTTQAMIIALFELEVLQKWLGIEEEVKYRVGLEWESASRDSGIKRNIELYLKAKEAQDEKLK